MVIFSGCGSTLAATDDNILCQYESPVAQISIKKVTHSVWDKKPGILGLNVYFRNIKTGHTYVSNHQLAGKLMGCIIEGLASAVDENTTRIDEDWTVIFKGKSLGITIVCRIGGVITQQDLSRDEAIDLIKKIGSHYNFNMTKRESTSTAKPSATGPYSPPTGFPK